MVHRGTPGDSPQCGEMSRSDKGAGHVSSAAFPTMFICICTVKNGTGHVPTYPIMHYALKMARKASKTLPSVLNINI